MGGVHALTYHPLALEVSSYAILVLSCYMKCSVLGPAYTYRSRLASPMHVGLIGERSTVIDRICLNTNYRQGAELLWGQLRSRDRK